VKRILNLPAQLGVPEAEQVEIVTKESGYFSSVEEEWFFISKECLNRN
jgi:hypothetical protein